MSECSHVCSRTNFRLVYFIEELAVYLTKTLRFSFFSDGVSLWKLSLLVLLLFCASCAGCGQKKPQNKNAANSLLRAIELFIWCQAENGTEGVRNVENKFSAFLFLCKVNELCKLPWISFGSVILSVIFQIVAKVLEALKYIRCIDKFGQVILVEKKSCKPLAASFRHS